MVTKLAERLSEIREESTMALKFSSWGNAAPILRDQLPFLLQVIEKQRAALELMAGPMEFACEIGDRSKQACAQRTIAEVEALASEIEPPIK